MAILGHGIDLTSIARIRGALEKEHFAKRVFSAAEIQYCRSQKDPVPHFAARFAAKEAYGKAMGLGLGASGDLIEVEVISDAQGAPKLQLHGRALELWQKTGGKKIFLSLTHEEDWAMASVILES
jgi:holo-[acyl-carrier protein] synthase